MQDHLQSVNANQATLFDFWNAISHGIYGCPEVNFMFKKMGSISLGILRGWSFLQSSVVFSDID